MIEGCAPQSRVTSKPCSRSAVELQEFHAAPPVFNLARLDLETSRQSFERAIADERCGVFVAEEGDRIIGMMQVEPATRYRTVATIGIAIATEGARSQGVGTEILAHVVEWAREQGYEYCAVGWTSANRISDAFWRSRGFQPTRYKLARRFDIARPRSRGPLGSRHSPAHPCLGSST